MKPFHIAVMLALFLFGPIGAADDVYAFFSDHCYLFRLKLDTPESEWERWSLVCGVGTGNVANDIMPGPDGKTVTTLTEGSWTLPDPGHPGQEPPRTDEDGRVIRIAESCQKDTVKFNKYEDFRECYKGLCYSSNRQKFICHALWLDNGQPRDGGVAILDFSNPSYMVRIPSSDALAVINDRIIYYKGRTRMRPLWSCTLDGSDERVEYRFHENQYPKDDFFPADMFLIGDQPHILFADTDKNAFVLCRVTREGEQEERLRCDGRYVGRPRDGIFYFVSTAGKLCAVDCTDLSKHTEILSLDEIGLKNTCSHVVAYGLPGDYDVLVQPSPDGRKVICATQEISHQHALVSVWVYDVSAKQWSRPFKVENAGYGFVDRVVFLSTSCP